MSFLSIIAAASTAAESAAESIAETVAETAAEGGAVTSMVPEDFAFDYAMRVPVLSIILMVIALAVMIAVPVYLIIRMKNRFRFDVYALDFLLTWSALASFLLSSSFWLHKSHLLRSFYHPTQLRQMLCTSHF